MTNRLRDVVVAQHRRLLTVIDRAETQPDLAAIRRVERTLRAHLDAEAELVYPLAEAFSAGLRYGHEEHVVLRFALDRVAAAETAMERVTRLRVLRDLFVHHTEREEWVTLQLLESRLEPAKATALARRMEARFASESGDSPSTPPAVRQARRKAT